MVGNKIRKRLKELSMSQKDLADNLNISPSTLSGYLTGYRTPDLNTVSKLAKALDVPVSYLIEDVNDGVDYISESPTSFSVKEKKDIALDLEIFKKELMESEELLFDGEPMSDESINNILSALQIGMEMVRQKNKTKYTPKKYRK
jgi:transcriptional regulator with XRE-family HTH domain